MHETIMKKTRKPATPNAVVIDAAPRHPEREAGAPVH